MKTLLQRLRAPMLCLAFSLLAAAPTAMAEEVVNIYSYRQEFLIKPILDEFTRETGIKTQVLFADKGLIERLQAEGRNARADVLLTADVNLLERAKEQGLSQPIDLEAVRTRVPAPYRDAEGHWFGLTLRARVVYASKDRVDERELTYEDLADPRYRGRVCSRSGQHPYSLTLFASLIAHHGEEKAKALIAGIRDNLARRPTGNDRAQVKAVYAGECDFAIGNTYYMGLMQTNTEDPEQKLWAEAVRLIFPNSEGRGSHVNISGVLLTKHAPNKANAEKLMTFLLSDTAQKLYAEVNFEYPVVLGVPASERVRSWGDLKPDALSLSELARHREAASRLVSETDFDEGPQ